MTCWSWSDRLRNSFSVTTWLMNTCCCCCCCSAPCWDCILTFSKVTSLPPNYKRTNKQSQFEHKNVAKQCFYYTYTNRKDCDLNIYHLDKISGPTIWPQSSIIIPLQETHLLDKIALQFLTYFILLTSTYSMLLLFKAQANVTLSIPDAFSVLMYYRSLLIQLWVICICLTSWSRCCFGGRQ